MKIHHQRRRGIVLIIVMLVIVVLAVLAGGFAYSMKVETKLARNTSYESDMEWLGRSGVELGKYALAQQLASPPPDNLYTALNQVWAGGPGNPTNEVLADIHLENVELGPGRFTVRIVDMERKFNLSVVNEGSVMILERALELIGSDSLDTSTIIDSYLDWIDRDENTHPNGAESRDYLKGRSPYFAKNGPIDDIRELLLIQGMTPGIFWGAGRTGAPVGGGPPPMRRGSSAFLQGAPQSHGVSVGLVDLFTPVGGMGAAVNVNTASREVMMLVPGVDEGIAAGIIDLRAGSDGQDGNEDDTPLANPGELINVPGIDPAIVNALRNAFTCQSTLFEITVEAEIGRYKRQFVALVNRRSRMEVNTLYFHWK